MLTINEVIQTFNSSLTEFMGAGEATSCARIALEKVTGISRSELAFEYDTVLEPKQIDQLNHIILELKTGRPLQYIIHETWFYGWPFYVDDRVLIPRPETEELVDLVLKENELENIHDSGKKVLDIGTGSGCIPITLSLSKPHWKVFGIDVSPGALEVAIQNASTLKTSVLFQLVDVLDNANALEFFKKHGPFDVIISNPPYIAMDEKRYLSANVLNFEPHVALFANQHDALVFYRNINRFAKEFLKPGGVIYYEISEFKGKEMIQLMQEHQFNEVELINDLNNKNRIIKAVK